MHGKAQAQQTGIGLPALDDTMLSRSVGGEIAHLAIPVAMARERWR